MSRLSDAARCAPPSLLERSAHDPALRRLLGAARRVDDRCRADPGARARFVTDPASARQASAIELDDQTIAAIAGGHRDGAGTDVASLYDRFASERHPERVRHAPPPINRRYRAWRAANIARCDLQLSRRHNSVIPHSPFAVELTDGCSVGCWFCGAGAAKLTGRVAYDDVSGLWREMLGVLADVCGPANATYGFLYWATDPLDHPDYERFCADYADRFGVWPATTTALPLKNVERTRTLLREAERHGQRRNRFSILTLRMLDRLEQCFSPDELLFVELVLQNPEAEGLKSLEGRFLTAAERDPALAERELAKLKAWVSNPDDPSVALPTTTSCVTGFIVNLVRRRVQLVSPCRSNAAWPLGHYVFAEANFETAEDFRRVVERMIEDVMTATIPADRAMRLDDGLQCVATPGGLRVISRTEEIDLEGDEVRAFLQALPDRLSGIATPNETVAWAADRFGIDTRAARGVLRALWRAGALDMAPTSSSHPASG